MTSARHKHRQALVAIMKRIEEMDNTYCEWPEDQHEALGYAMSDIRAIVEQELKLKIKRSR